jgi:hypothetical protein
MTPSDPPSDSAAASRTARSILVALVAGLVPAIAVGAVLWPRINALEDKVTQLANDLDTAVNALSPQQADTFERLLRVQKLTEGLAQHAASPATGAATAATIAALLPPATLDAITRDGRMAELSLGSFGDETLLFIPADYAATGVLPELEKAGITVIFTD